MSSGVVWPASRFLSLPPKALLICRETKNCLSVIIKSPLNGLFYYTIEFAEFQKNSKIKNMKTLINTTLCYIEKDNEYLMLHRTKKEHDYNKDKWIGIGGKFENGESPEDCAVREVREETGLNIAPEDLEYCGIVIYTEFMHIFRARKFSGSLKTDCDEGDLEWVPLSKLKELPHWQADEIFYDFLEQNHPFYSLKAVYKNNKLIETYLNGKEYNHWK